MTLKFKCFFYNEKLELKLSPFVSSDIPDQSVICVVSVRPLSMIW